MNPGGFVSKQQFQAVYEHFRDVVTQAEAEGNMLHVEFHLLLEYFRTVYSDSERKTYKILQLSTKMAKDGSLLDKLGSARARENEELALQVCETKSKIDELVKKELALLKQVDKMKAFIKKLKKTSEWENEMDDDDERSFKTVGVVTDSPDEEENLGWRSCEICSKKSREAVDEILKEMDYQDRQKEAIREMTTKMNAKETELEIVYQERHELHELTRHYSQLLEESRLKLEQGERNWRAVESQASEKKKLEVAMEKLEQDLVGKKSEVQALQEKIRKERSEWNARMLEWKSTDKHLEEVRKALQAAREAEGAALKKAEVLERHLATDKGRREVMAGEIVLMRLEADGLKKQLRESQERQKAMVGYMKAEEMHHRNKLMELSHTLENHETEKNVKNEQIKSLMHKLSQTEKHLEYLKKQTKSKSPSYPTVELERLKAELRDLNSAHKTAQFQLETFRTATENQQTKINSMKRVNEMLLKEKNKFFCRYKALDTKLETQKKHTKLIINERDYHRKVLRSIDNQVEKLAKQEKKNTSFR